MKQPTRQISKIKIGILGAGYITEAGHLPALSKLKNIQVVAICDLDNAKASYLANRYKIDKTYSDYDAMLEKENLDVVDILTSSDKHIDHAIMAMEQGCHCIIEKPLAITTAEADKAILKAAEKNLGLFVTHNWSFMHSMKKVKAIVASGALGKIIEVDVRYLTSFGVERYFDPIHWCHGLPGGIFADISPHLAMILLDFLNNIKSIKTISTKISDYPHIDADELKLMLEAENGLGSFTLSFNSPVRQFTIDVTGTKMSLSLDASAQIIIMHKPVGGDKPIMSVREGIPRGLMEVNKVVQHIGGLSSNVANVIMGRYSALEGHIYLINEALESIRGVAAYPIDIYKCREVVRILETAFSFVGINEAKPME